jgi:hypothetical protein
VWLAEQGEEPKLETLLELVPKVEVFELRTRMIEALTKQAAPRFKAGRPGTPQELAAIIAAEEKAQHAQSTLTVAGDLARLEVNRGDQGYSALFRLREGRWVKVTDLGGWIH